MAVSRPRQRESRAEPSRRTNTTQDPRCWYASITQSRSKPGYHPLSSHIFSRVYLHPTPLPHLHPTFESISTAYLQLIFSPYTTSIELIMPLPADLVTFRAHHLEQLSLNAEETCVICRDPYDDNLLHTAVRIIGIDNCNHIFGQTCLDAWIGSGCSNSNTCPMCRTELFKYRETVDGQFREAREALTNTHLALVNLESDLVARMLVWFSASRNRATRPVMTFEECMSPHEIASNF